MMEWGEGEYRRTSPNTAHTLPAHALTLRDIAPFDRNVVYAGNVRRNARKIRINDPN